MKRRNFVSLLATLTLVGVSSALLTSCTGDQKAQAPPVQTTPTPVASPDGEGIIATPSPEAAASRVTIYKVGSNADGEGQLQPVETKIDRGNDVAAVLALNQMADGADSPLPKGTRARSVRFDGELATVDFSTEFEKNFEGGDRKEALMFNAILATLGQFPNITKVQILVEGKKVSIGGTQDTENPMNVPADLVASAKTKP